MIKLREATIEDVHAVHRFLVETPFLGNGDPEMFVPETVKDYISKSGNVVIIAEVDGVLAGVLWMLVYADYINTGVCGVKPEFERQGVYKALSEYRTTYALERDIHWLDTMTEDTNVRMQEIFEKQGYQKKGNFIAYYKEI